MLSYFSSPSFSLSKKRKKNKNNNSKKNNNNNDNNKMATVPIVKDTVPFTSTHYGLGYHLDTTLITDTNVNNDLTFERNVLTSPSKSLQQDRVSSTDIPSIKALGHSHYDDVDDNNNNNSNRLHDISSPSNTNHLSQQTPSSDHSHHLHHHHHDSSKISTEMKRRRSSALLHFIRGFISPESMNIQRYAYSSSSAILHTVYAT